jgi:hypothetical protein
LRSDNNVEVSQTIIDGGIIQQLPTAGMGAEERFGIHRNHFHDVQCQCDQGTSVGVRNIRHIGNMFVDVKVWDIPQSASSSTIHQDATNTLIVGGIMTNSFQDNGQFTKILDEWQGLQIGNDIAIPAAAIIGSSPPEPVGFFGTAPVTQQAGSASGQNAGNSYGPTEQDMLNAVYSALKAYGLIN